MSFAEALNTALLRGLMFRGRASRPEFWWVMLFWGLTWTTLAAVSALSFPGAAVPLPMIFALATAVPMAAVTFRRVQDTGRSGWLSLTWVIGAAISSGGRLIGEPELVFAGTAAEIGIIVVILAWCAAPGTPGRNPYGPSPDAGRRGGAS